MNGQMNRRKILSLATMTLAGWTLMGIPRNKPEAGEKGGSVNSGRVGNDFFPPFSDEEFERRWKMMKTAMEEKGLDCLVVYGAYRFAGNDMGQVNAVYLSNFASVVQTYVVFPRKEDPTLVIGLGAHIPNAKKISAIRDIRAGRGFEVEAGERLKELNLEKGHIGIVGPYAGFSRLTIPSEHRDYFAKILPGAKFENVTDWYENLRLIKSAEEIRLMERAGALSDLAHEEIFLATRPGIRHTDLRRVLGDVANRFGGSYPFSHVGSTSMADPEGFYPDFYPTHQTVERGHVVMTEICLGYGNYFGKLWGTYFVGDPAPEYRRMFDFAAALHDRVIRDLKPGMKGREINRYMEAFQDAGFRPQGTILNGWSTYNHAPICGGLEGTPLAMRVQPFQDFEFKPGHCLTIVIWPSIPGTKKGLWVGSTGVITRDGFKKFHSYPINQLRVVPTS
jgi:Xaa-Pro aminopeptidase